MNFYVWSSYSILKLGIEVWSRVLKSTVKPWSGGLSLSLDEVEVNTCIIKLKDSV